MQQPMTVLYDSLCPVCSREVRLLKHFDRKDNLNAIDIAAAEFDPSLYGLSLEECVGSLRGIDASGRPLDGMNTIRAMYAAVGLAWLMRWTSLPLIRQICDLGYRLFARVRPAFSSFKPGQCDTNRCRPKGDTNE